MTTETIMTVENDNEKCTNKDSTYSTEQVISLQKVINSLKQELDAKDASLANTSKEKERLKSDLKKFKRANNNLKQQLEDERTFYLKEKEYYCKEMSVNKKMKKKQHEELRNSEDIIEQLKEINNLKKEVTKLKVVLNETLEANYNLSIKFLRMKNTKYTLKARYKREQTENAKIISDLTIKLESTREEMLHIISEKFKQCIPPSNKKYLQVVKQNTQLMHDNLSFQIQISKLCNDIERIKAEKVKHETSLRLQYARKFKVQYKESSDKMCEADLCIECKSVNSNNSFDIHKPSNCTISTTTGKDFDVFSGIEISLYPKINQTMAHSVPNFNNKNNFDSCEVSEFDLQNT